MNARRYFKFLKYDLSRCERCGRLLKTKMISKNKYIEREFPIPHETYSISGVSFKLCIPCYEDKITGIRCKIDIEDRFFIPKRPYDKTLTPPPTSKTYKLVKKVHKLRQANNTWKEISDKTGYSSVSHLIKLYYRNIKFIK